MSFAVHFSIPGCTDMKICQLRQFTSCTQNTELELTLQIFTYARNVVNVKDCILSKVMACSGEEHATDTSEQCKITENVTVRSRFDSSFLEPGQMNPPGPLLPRIPESKVLRFCNHYFLLPGTLIIFYNSVRNDS